ncbi:hypothetical protein [Streptomyces californicus]|uniref:hypothetical protein n=1 Tax=Streptomyces californicus TaxID=67351 RepID=UPI0033BAD7E4
MVTVPTRDGGTVEITRRGPLVDLHVRDAEGRTVATVVRRASEAARIMAGYSPKSGLVAPS